MTMPTMPIPIVEPVGITEIAERLRVKADTVRKWRTRHESFPPPRATLAHGPIWEWAEVATWQARRDQLIYGTRLLKR